MDRRRLPGTGRDRRSDGSERGRARDRLAPSRVRGRGPGVRRVRGPGLRLLRRRGRHRARSLARSAAGLPRGARHHRPDRVLRAARGRPSERGGDGGRVGRGRCHRERSPGRSPGSRDAGSIGIAGGPEKCRLDRRGTRLRRGHRLQGPGRRSSAARSTHPAASTCSSTTSAARFSMPSSTRLARGARIVLSGGVSQYNAEHARGPSNYLALSLRARR